MRFIQNMLVFLNRRTVRVVLSLALTLVVGVLLIVAIQFTLFDLQWLAFLGGILFAAILAMVSQASKAEWMIARRTAQLEHVRKQLAQETSRSHNVGEALRATEIRMRMVNDLLPAPILFIDRDLRIRYHNKAACDLTGWPSDQIEGQLLRDVITVNYPLMLEHFRNPLSGFAENYTLAWLGQNGTPENFMVKQMPYPADDGRPLGFYLVMLPAAAGKADTPDAADAADGSETARTRPDPYAAITNESGEMLYLHSISDQRPGSDDSRTKLVRALKQNEFLLFAQKILPLKNRPLDDHGCYEILLRLQEEENNLLPPGGFIPVAERYGMTEDIDRWVVHNLITWSLERRRTHPGWEIPRFSVNLSEAAVINPEFARFVRQELQHHAFPASQLCFEIGELETIHNHDSVGHFIAALKPAGCRFTIDAFGSVKLSFTHLTGLAVDFIKIDGVIIQNLFKTPADTKKLQAIVTVCQRLGVQTIAEFVEDDRTLEKLRELGIDYAQGFGIDRPVPIAKVR